MANNASQTRDWSQSYRSCKKKWRDNFLYFTRSNKVYGEGEWKVRQYGFSKRRTWLKLHVTVNVHNHHIEAFQVTQNNTADSEAAPHVIETTRAPIKQIDADGAYDASSVYQAAEAVGAARLVIPPRKHAKLHNPVHAISAKSPRDAAITYIQQHGGGDNARAACKKDSNYHARSLSETAMYRFTTHF